MMSDNEQKVANQKVVTFTYIILDDKGSVQEQSDIPMAYVHGVDDRVIPRVAAAMEGKKVGDQVEVEVPPEDGFGLRDETLIFRDKLENVPPEYHRVGAEAMFQNDAGETKAMLVTKIENGEIEIDGNHPFAGKTMTFKLVIKDIRDASQEEAGTGRAIINPVSDIKH